MLRRLNRFHPGRIPFGFRLAFPIILFSSLVLIYPVISTFSLSFFDQRIIGTEAPFVGLDLFKKVISSSEVHAALGRSMFWTFGNVILNNAFALAVALLLYQRFVGHSIVESAILIPWIIPNVISAIIWRFMLHPTLGVVNYFLLSTGFISDPLLFLAQKSQAMPTLIGVNVWTFFGLRALTILAALMAIPEELFDAAKVDGANAVQRFAYVIWPAIAPVMAVVVLLGGFQTFNKVDLPWLLAKGGPGEATTTLPVLIYRKAYLSFRFSEAAVLSVLMAVLLAFVAVIYFRVNPPENQETM